MMKNLRIEPIKYQKSSESKHRDPEAHSIGYALHHSKKHKKTRDDSPIRSSTTQPKKKAVAKTQTYSPQDKGSRDKTSKSNRFAHPFNPKNNLIKSNRAQMSESDNDEETPIKKNTKEKEKKKVAKAEANKFREGRDRRKPKNKYHHPDNMPNNFHSSSHTQTKTHSKKHHHHKKHKKNKNADEIGDQADESDEDVQIPALDQQSMRQFMSGQSIAQKKLWNIM